MMQLLLWIPIILPSIACTGAQETTGDPAVAAPTETRKAEITPSHAYQQVALVRAGIDLIRQEMGRPEVESPPIHVERAAPREVYFQALTLLSKADRLAFEHTRERVGKPPLPTGQIQPVHVRAVVDAALDRVTRVKEVLGILEKPEPPSLEPDVEPSQVFNAIVAANRELNHLLDQKFAPADVYRQVTEGIACMARLLDTPGEVSTPPEPPPFVRRKRPTDVFERLVSCFDEIHEIGEKSGIAMLDLRVDAQRTGHIEPSDVYDVAALLVSELNHLHGQRPGAALPRRVYNPGRKLPSHVYQRIGVLSKQMEVLQRKVESDPDWLKH